MKTDHSSLEICAGAGGQAIGLEEAGFKHVSLIEIESYACKTLKLNRPQWDVVNNDIREVNGRNYKGIDLFSGGVPCPPFSKAGKQLGSNDERDLFPEAIRLISESKPKVVMLENVRGLLDAIFDDYRNKVEKQLNSLGYVTSWKLLNACDFGVSQLRPRVIFVGLKREYAEYFDWPKPILCPPKTVGNLLFDLMFQNGWLGAESWRMNANSIAPTLVGGSKKHGGADLGPTRSRKAWASIGVDGSGISDEPPMKNYIGLPKLTTKMTARIQGFNDDWSFYGKKTVVYRQIGNAFPPQVAKAVGKQLKKALLKRKNDEPI